MARNKESMLLGGSESSSDDDDSGDENRVSVSAGMVGSAAAAASTTAKKPAPAPASPPATPPAPTPNQPQHPVSAPIGPSSSVASFVASQRSTTASLAHSAAAATLMDYTALERKAKQRKEMSLTLTRVLMKYLERKNPNMHARAKAVIKECAERNKSTDAAHAPLPSSIQTHLRAMVGEVYWRKAEDYLKHILKQKLKQQKLKKQAATMAVAGAQRDDYGLAGAIRLICTASLHIVGIGNYADVVQPGEFVTLVREPRNPCDCNAIRVDNIDGEKVGHVDATEAEVLAPIVDCMDHFRLSRIDGSIPQKGDLRGLPLKLEFYAHDRIGPNRELSGHILTKYMRDKAQRVFFVEYPLGTGDNSLSALEPIFPPVEVKTSVVVTEFKSQEELDRMFERQQAKLAELPQIDVPPQIRPTSRLMDHQMVGVAWMIHREKGGNAEEVPFYKRVQEQGKTIWLSEITHARQESMPSPVFGGILADDMGLGKTLQCLCLILANPPEGRMYPIRSDEEDTEVLKKVPAIQLKRVKDEAAEPLASAKKGSTSTGPTPGNSPELEVVVMPQAAAINSKLEVALQSVSLSQVRNVPVKNLRWILSQVHCLCGSSYPLGLDPTTRERTKKPDLVKICHEHLMNGSLSVERFKAGSSASTEPPTIPVSAIQNDPPLALIAATGGASVDLPVTSVTSPAAIMTAMADLSGEVHARVEDATNSGKGNITTLVVCPVSVMSNWDQQIKTHVMDSVLRVEHYQGPRRWHILQNVLSNKVDVLVVSYNVLANEFKANSSNSEEIPPNKRGRIDSNTTGFVSLFDIDFHRVILDEAHVIRNIKARTFKACCALTCQKRLCLTGTPLQNRPEDIQSLFAFLSFEPLSNADIFHHCIAQPIKNGDSAGLSRLRLAMCHVALRRTKESVDIHLGEREVQIRSVSMEPNSIHQAIYNLLFDSAQSVFQATLLYGDKEALKNYMSILETLLRIRQACCSGVLIPKDRLRRAEMVMGELKERFEGGEPLTVEEGRALFEKLKGKFEEEIECAICLCEMPREDTVILRSCSHFFCKACILKVSNQSQKLCPLCRGPFEKSQMVKRSSLPGKDSDQSTLYHYGRSIADVAASKLEQSPKVCALLEAIAEMEGDEKGVIFSQFTKFLDVIEKALSSHGHSFCRIDGSTKASDRIAAMKEFNSETGGPRFILCSLKAAGTGINLTRANHVYMCDLWWNKAVEDQALDRCHRIGQKRKVRILKFVITDSIEERLIKMQEAKAALGKGAMQLLDAEEMRKTRIAALKDLFDITTEIG